MKKILYFLMVGLAFTALQVGAAEAQTGAPGTAPMGDTMGDPNMAPPTGAPGTAAPMGDPNMAPATGEAGGPAATDMSNKMINDGGHGANSGLEAEDERAVAEQNCIKYVKKWEPNSKDHTESWCYDKGWEVHKNSCSAAEPC